jgi:sugar phosphate isomerase/epimerase
MESAIGSRTVPRTQAARKRQAAGSLEIDSAEERRTFSPAAMNTNPLNRRSAILKGATLAAGLSLPIRPAITADLIAQNKEQKQFRIGACDWTLGRTANPESLEMAKRIGLDGVQVDFGHEPDKQGNLPLSDPKLQDRFLELEQKTGVAIASLAMGVLNRVALKNDPSAEKWVMASVETAKRLKKNVVLLAFFGNGDLQNDDAGMQSVIGKLKALAPKAEEAGIVYGIESWLHVPVLEKILDAVKSPAIQVYYDVGNMHKVREDIYAAIPKLGRERICEFHMKDYDDLYGKGSIDFPKVRAAMDKIGYRGWMQIEGVKMPLGVEESVKFDADYLRKIFAV